MITFGVPPVRGGTVAESQQISGLIQGVLAEPWSESVPALLPLTKVVLLVVVTLHLPLVVIAVFLAITSWREPRS